MSDFNKAFEMVIGIEGGYVNDPDDAGGETKYGISKRAYPNEDIKNLTLDRAKELYKRDYWDVNKLDQVNIQSIAEEIFDMGVNCGITTAAKTIQQAINLTNYPDADINVDGLVGSGTLGKINSHPRPKELYKAFEGLKLMYYIHIVQGNPKQEKFFRSWLSRTFKEGQYA